jgi:hypothetical protein
LLEAQGWGSADPEPQGETIAGRGDTRVAAAGESDPGYHRPAPNLAIVALPGLEAGLTLGERLRFYPLRVTRIFPFLCR